MSLIDTHTHLDSFAKQGSLPGILDRARAAGLDGMIAIGTEPGDWEIHLGIARDNPGFVHAAVGLHPCLVDAGWEKAVGEIESFWQRGQVDRLDVTPYWQRGQADAGDVAPRDITSIGLTPSMTPLPVALGECGLDRFHLPKDPVEAEKIFSWQRAAFAAQLDLARRLGCPLVIHSRGAFRECVGLITASGVDWSKVVFHCFSEGPAEIAELVALGGRGSFTGILTYKNAETVRAAAKTQGLARLMIETDAPYLAPAPHRGKPNEPSYVKHIADFAAELFGVSQEELAAVTTANARKFFAI